MASTDLSVLSTSQETWISDQVQDTFWDSTETVYRIAKSAAKRRVDGGETLKATIQTTGFNSQNDSDPLIGAGDGTSFNANNNNVIADGAKYKVVRAEFLRTISFNWKHYGLSLQRDKSDFDIYNKGKARVINLQMEALDNLKESIKQEIATDFWRDGHENDANNTFQRRMISIRAALVPNSVVDPGGAGTYGGLTLAQHVNNAPIVRNLNGAEVTVADVASVLNELKMRRRAKPTAIYCGFARYNALEQEALGAIRHPAVRPGVATELGIETFSIHGVPVIVDPFLEDSVASGNANWGWNLAGSRQIYILSDDWALCPQPNGALDGHKVVNEYFRMTDWTDLTPVLNLQRYQVNINAAMSLVCLNRRHQAVITNTAA